MLPSRRRFLVAALACPLIACRKDAPSSEGAASQPRAGLDPQPDPEPGAEANSPASEGASDLEARVAELRARFADRDWTVLAEPPFAVVGDGTPARVQRHAEGTIRWAVEHLRAAYFDEDPDAVITVWLFETASSYERHAEELFDEAPDTPYGYYSPTHDALVMNIGTGGGTLVHEIVHPFMAANFPACPDWFNEGLASLYEQSAERDGSIVGLTNWRLAGLQDALADNAVPTFRELCESGERFYSHDPGTNYAQARYLCYWLQEHGLLRRYYRAFRANAERDPSGYATLLEVLGVTMSEFRPAWERDVLALRYG